jgi:hypothetical protein
LEIDLALEGENIPVKTPTPMARRAGTKLRLIFGYFEGTGRSDGLGFGEWQSSEVMRERRYQLAD